MWIFLNNAMVSVVAHRDKPASLMVRARFPGDLGRALGRVKEKHTPAADYAYRCTVTRARFARRLAHLATKINYPNFKGSIAHHDVARKSAYGDVWCAMFTAQERHLGRAPRQEFLDHPEPSWRRDQLPLPGLDLVGSTFESLGGDRADLDRDDGGDGWNR